MSKCSECTYLKLCKENIYGKMWCEKRLMDVLPTDEACYRFTRAYSRSSSDIKSAEEYSKNHQSSGCYLTTMMCKILGLKDDNVYLNKMRSFRTDILQKDDKYKPLLVEYDIVGPKIAEVLETDPMRFQISTTCLEKSILPIIDCLDKKDYDTAVNKYVYMTNSLKGLYNLNNIEISKDIVNKADINKSGHGIYKVKTLKKEV